MPPTHLHTEQLLSPPLNPQAFHWLPPEGSSFSYHTTPSQVQQPTTTQSSPLYVKHSRSEIEYQNLRCSWDGGAAELPPLLAWAQRFQLEIRCNKSLFGPQTIRISGVLERILIVATYKNPPPGFSSYSIRLALIDQSEAAPAAAHLHLVPNPSSSELLLPPAWSPTGYLVLVPPPTRL